MKKFPAVVLLACLCLLPDLRADITIVQQIDGDGQNRESTTKIRSDKTRIDASPATSIIMDLKSGEVISLMHAEKKYVKIPSQMTQAALESVRKMQGNQAAAPPNLAPTGKKESISGYPTEEYTLNFGGHKLSLWLTKALPDYQDVLKQMAAAFSQGPMAAMVKNLGMDFTTLPGFPIRTVNEWQPGRLLTSTVVSVSTAPIPDSDFEIPASYQAMVIPSLTPPAAADSRAVSK